MEVPGYTEKKMSFVLGNGEVVATDRSSVGYLTKRDIGKVLAELAADAGYKQGDSVEYYILIKERINPSSDILSASRIHGRTSAPE